MLSQQMLVRAAVSAHLAVIVSTAAAVLGGRSPLAVELSLLMALVLPLLVTIRGLSAARRRTLQLLSVLLVVYIGVAAVEVVAAQGSWPEAAWLVAAGLELALILTIIRRLNRPGSRVSEES